MSENEKDLGFEIVDDADVKEEKEDNGMLFIFPDENEDSDSDDDGGEGISLSFGKVSAKKKEEDLRFLPFLNIPDRADEEEEDPNDFSGKKSDDDDDENVSLSFGKVSAARKEEDYVYLPFLKSEEEISKDEKEEEEEEDDGIDIVGGEEMLNLTPLKTSNTGKRIDSFDRDEDDVRRPSPYAKKKPGAGKKGPKGASSQGQRKKPNGQRPQAQQKPNKVQQILSAMDPDVLAAVSGDPRQMMLLEETVRSELIKQAAHNAVAKELSGDVLAELESQQKIKSMQQRDSRPQQGGRQRPKQPSYREPRERNATLNFAHADIHSGKSNTPLMDISQTLSEFGEEAPAIPKPQPQVQQIPQVQPQVQPKPVVQPVIQQTPAAAPVQQQTSPVQTPQAQPQQRKAYVSNSPAAIRAAMKAGMAMPDSTQPSAPSSNDSVQKPVNAQNKNRTPQIAPKQGENRSGCAIGIIVAIMIVFVGLIVIISGRNACSNLESSGAYEQAEMLYQEKRYEEAIDVLSEITDYPKSGNLICDCYYMMGKNAEASGDLDKAIEQYSKIKSKDYTSYKDVVSAVRELTLKSARQLENEEKYIEACEKYNNFLASYSESMTETDREQFEKTGNACKYKYAKILFDDAKYSDAETYFRQLKLINYPGAEAYYAKCLLRAGEMYFNNGQYGLAKEKLSFISEGQDALNDEDYAQALDYYSLSSHNVSISSNMLVDDELKSNLSLLEKAFSMTEDEEMKELITKAMSDYAYDKFKLVGKWKLNGMNYFELTEDGTITIKFSFNVMQDVKIGTFKVLAIQKGRLAAKNDDGESFMLDRLNFEPMTSSKPDKVAFVNMYDNIAYTFYREED